MTRSHDIREWARAQGRPVGDRGKIAQDIQDDYDAEHGEAYAEAFPDETVVDDAELPEIPERVEETPPKVPSTGDRFRDSLRRARKRSSSGPKKVTTKSGKTHPRASIEEVMALAWGALGGGVAKTGLLSSGFIMTKQAPVAGMVLEDALKGSAIDRLVQPIARQSERAKLFKALFFPPLAAGILQARPDLYDQLEQPLRRAIGDWLDVAGPKMEEIKRRNEEFEKEFGEEIDDIMEGLKAAIAIAWQQREEAAKKQKQGADNATGSP